jgi:hypothetical protein
MKITNVLLLVALVLGMATMSVARAQAPAGSTGQCKDNSYTNAATKRGACRGHGGVKEWYATTEAAPGKAHASKAAATPGKEPESAKPKANETAPVHSTKSTTPARGEPAPGGGAGKVWLNTATNVYHCAGTSWYGKTKQGEYVTEGEAKAKNAHPDHGKACT